LLLEVAVEAAVLMGQIMAAVEAGLEDSEQALIPLFRLPLTQ